MCVAVVNGQVFPRRECFGVGRPVVWSPVFLVVRCVMSEVVVKQVSEVEYLTGVRQDDGDIT